MAKVRNNHPLNKKKLPTKIPPEMCKTSSSLAVAQLVFIKISGHEMETGTNIFFVIWQSRPDRNAAPCSRIDTGLVGAKMVADTTKNYSTDGGRFSLDPKCRFFKTINRQCPKI
jgi:hypothetical protein